MSISMIANTLVSIRRLKKHKKKRLFQWSNPGIVAVNHSPIVLSNSAAPHIKEENNWFQLFTRPCFLLEMGSAAYLAALSVHPVSWV